MFNFNNSCKHEKILANMQKGYCPDCGEYVENHWYISRCACCGLKQKTTIFRGKIKADTKFCRNCGSSTFFEQELDKIDIVNINYAVLLKKISKRRLTGVIQTWIDENQHGALKLLPVYSY